MTGSRNDVTDRISHEQQRAAADLSLRSSAPASSSEETSAAGFFTPDASGDQRLFQPVWWRPWVVGIIVFLVIAGSRWPLRTTYLATFDAANFTFALDDFNPAYHRPQPPGDPLFVVVTRALHLAIPAPEQVLPAAGILGSILAVLLLFKLGNAMFGRPVGMCAAVLLSAHPALWFAGVVYPVRVYLAAGSAAVALLCWFALRLPQQRRWFWYAGAVLGISAGFRPELLLFLSPVVLFAVVAGRNKRVAVFTLAAAVLTSAAWIVPMAMTFGGILPMLEFFGNYLRERSGDSVVLGANLETAVPHWLVAFQWTFLPVLAWVWAIPFMRPGSRSEGTASRWIFLAIWLLPGFLFHAIVHVHHPDQTLAAAPPLCLLGGWVLAQRVRGEWRAPWRSGIRAVLLTATVAVSAFFFWHRLHWEPRATGYYTELEWLETATRASMERIEESRRDAPIYLISANSAVPWRVLQYYFPEQTLIVLPDDLRQEPPPNSEVWFIRNNVVEQHFPAAGPIPLPAQGRGVWLTPQDEGIQNILAGTLEAEKKGSVWSFTPRPGTEFQAGRYHFVAGP